MSSPILVCPADTTRMRGRETSQAEDPPPCWLLAPTLEERTGAASMVRSAMSTDFEGAETGPLDSGSITRASLGRETSAANGRAAHPAGIRALNPLALRTLSALAARHRCLT